MTTYTNLNEVVKQIIATIGPVDGIQVVYAHQVGDGCTVVFKHKNIDAIIATARMWLKNTVVYEGEEKSPRIPVVFGELTFGQQIANVSLQKKDAVTPADVPTVTPVTPVTDSTGYDPTPWMNIKGRPQATDPSASSASSGIGAGGV